MQKQNYKTALKKIIVEEINQNGLEATSKKYDVPMSILSTWQLSYEVLNKRIDMGNISAEKSLQIIKLETENSVLRERLIEECQNALANSMSFLNRRYTHPAI